MSTRRILDTTAGMGRRRTTTSRDPSYGIRRAETLVGQVAFLIGWALVVLVALRISYGVHPEPLFGPSTPATGQQ